MIFAAAYCFLVIGATTSLALIMPLSGLLVRASYLGRSIAIVKPRVVLSAAALALLSALAVKDQLLRMYHGGLLEMPPLLLGIRIILFSALMLHVTEDLRFNPIRRPAFISMVYHLTTRCWAIVLVRCSDTVFYARCRYREKVSLLEKLSIFVGTFVNILIELSKITKVIWTIAASRGGWPKDQRWMSNGVTHSRAFLGLNCRQLGDLILATLMIMLITCYQY